MTWDVIYCPLCGDEVYRHLREPIQYRARVPHQLAGHSTDIYTAMIQASQEESNRVEQRAEDSCTSHFSEKHALRYRLWKRFGHAKIITFRLRGEKKRVVPPDTQQFEFSNYVRSPHEGDTALVRDIRSDDQPRRLE